MKQITVEDLDREEALLLYKGKIYVNGNHQFAFKEALEDEGKRLSLDIETEIDEIAKITYNLNQENKICSLDLYIDEYNAYLISHFKESLMSNLDFLKKYSQENGYKLGYFNNFEDSDCTLIQI